MDGPTPNPDLFGGGPKLNPTEFASAVSAISSAFGDPTRRDVFLFVHASEDGVTAAEVAKDFGLHVNVARHHLDKLAAGGYAEVVTHRPAGGGAGRPSKRYRSTDVAVMPTLPIRHDVVLINLLKRALSMLPPDQATAMAEEVGAEYGMAMATAMGDVGESQRSFRTALHMVADAMTAHGFAAHVDVHGDQDEPRLISQHCPFGGADVVHPVICAVDRGMVRGMMGALYGANQPVHHASILDGDDHCTTAVELRT